MKTMKIMFCTSLLCAAALYADDAGLLFKAAYDGYNTAPDVAVNREEAKGGIAPELQLRMNRDVTGGRGNSLTLTTPEYVVYPAAGNLRPDRGTVSFWVKPCDYTLNDAKNFQIFFEARAGGFGLFVYKFFSSANRVYFYLFNGKDRNVVRAAANWREDEWHHLAVTWDESGMSLYIDGAIPEKTEGSSVPSIAFDPPMSLPARLKGGTFALNRHDEWKYVANGRLTAYDQLEIYDRRLNASEIYAKFAKIRPDMASRVSAPVDNAPTPLRLTYKTIPRDKRITVNLNLGAVLPPSQDEAVVGLLMSEKSSGDVVLATNATCSAANASIDLFFGDRLKENAEYEIVASLPSSGLSAAARFRVPDMSFLRDRMAVDETVPGPWFPVKEEGNMRFSVLDRTYEFSKGVFPSKVVSRGAEVLSRPPVLEVDGKPVTWESPHVAARHGDRIVLAARGSCDGMRMASTAELWFDGFLKLDFSMTPSAGTDAKIDSLRLSWNVPAAAARYLFTPLQRPFASGRYDGNFSVERNGSSIIWLSGVVEGLAWWCGSDANWRTDGDKPNLHVVRAGDIAEVTVDVIAKGASFKGGLGYTMGFQATPSRRPDGKFRNVRYGTGGLCNFKSCGWTSSSGIHAPDSFRHWTSFVPNYPDEFGTYLKKMSARGIDVVAYSMPTHLSPADEPWDFFSASWLKHPGVRWEFKDAATGARYPLLPCCSGTGVGDWHVANAARLLDCYPDLAGLYFDVSTVEDCDNDLHGHGGIDAFGRSFASSTALDLRAYYLRMLKVCRARNRQLHIHAHNLFFPFVHAFGDLFWPGEEQFHAYASNPRHHYQETITDEAYQSAWSTTIRGTGIFMIPQNSRVKEILPELVAKDEEAYVGRDAIFGAVMPSLVYDFTCMDRIGEKYNAPLVETWRALIPLKMENAEFHGFWYDPAVGAAEGIRSALYTWRKGEGPYPFLLVLGNFGRTAVGTAAKIDWGKTGMAPCMLKELLSGKVMDEDELARFVLRSHNYVLLVPAVPISS